MRIKLNRFTKTSLLLTLIGALTACASGPQRYQNQPAVPIGNQIGLNISANVAPGMFTVSRVRLYNDFLYRPVIYANKDDRYYSPSFGVDFRTEIHLASSAQPDVSALTCTDHRPEYNHKTDYPGRSHFEAALGDFVTLP